VSADLQSTPRLIFRANPGESSIELKAERDVSWPVETPAARPALGYRLHRSGALDWMPQLAIVAVEKGTATILGGAAVLPAKKPR
jgi:hypothetical protein